jgi:DNA end-binding protein Ku
VPAEETPSRGRSLWSGSIVFGLVSIPVELHPAVSRDRPSLTTIDTEGVPLRRRYFCPKHDRPLDREEIVRGHGEEGGAFATFEDEEIEELGPESSREIKLEQFAPRVEIPPFIADRPYLLAPTEASTRPYKLLAHVLGEEDMAGIATFVMRGKAYLISIVAEDGLLRAQTLRYDDEIRSMDDLAPAPEVEPPKKLVAEVVDAIEEATEDALDPDELADLEARALRELAETKRDRDEDVIEPEVEPEPERGTVIDLMQSLKRSIEQTQAASAASNSGTDLEQMSKQELYATATELDIAGRSRMSKAQLVKAIRKAS